MTVASTQSPPRPAGARWKAAGLALLALCWPRAARADEPDPCKRIDQRGATFATCFDPGNRLYLSGSNDGLGAGIQVRSLIATDEPGTAWRLEHAFLRATSTTARYRGAAYEGRFLRHSREGYLLLPTNPPSRLPVPFDVGLEASVGRIEGAWSEAQIRVNAVRGALLADFARSETFRRRASIGAVARWDIVADRREKKLTEQIVAPFTIAALGLYAESQDGLTLASLQGEAGYARSGPQGWSRRLAAEVTLERIVMSFNDLPLSVYASGRYDNPGNGLRGEIGLRFALVSAAR